MYLEYPDVEREVRILQSKLPGLDAVLAKQVARAVAYLRQSERVLKKPSIAESLDWASALIALGAAELDDETCEQTIGFALKNHEDIKEIMADDEFIRCLVQ